MVRKQLGGFNWTLGLVSLSLAILLNACSTKEHQPKGDANNGGLLLPDGFEALVVVDSLGTARHFNVNTNGDIYVKLTDGARGLGNAAIRVSGRDGKADSIAYFGDYEEPRGYGPTSMRIHNGYLYFSTKGAIYRNKLTDAQLVPDSPIERVVTDDFKTEHIAKSLAFDDAGFMYVGFGSISNVCQEANREPGSPGQQPCRELAEHAGI
jgi:glucose/arabinose dehydrogenase